MGVVADVVIRVASAIEASLSVNGDKGIADLRFGTAVELKMIEDRKFYMQFP